jgi:uncharacterized protein
MNTIIEFIKQPWPWYVAGPIIGLTVPLLLILGNKPFGISSCLSHICAITYPSKIKYFQYDWRKEKWLLQFVLGIVIGGFIAGQLLSTHQPLNISPATIEDLRSLGVTDFSGSLPMDIYGVDQIFTLKGLLFFVFGGFLVGFGTRYAGGCTSGHSITGLSILHWPSLVATICFMIGGFAGTHLLLPIIFKLVN